MKKILIAIMAILMGFAVVAGEKVVQAVGIGNSYRSAINEALISALEQTQGITLTSSEKADIYAGDTSVSLNDKETNITEVNDSIKKTMQKWASGKIYGYSVVSHNYNELTKKYDVTLAVRVPGEYKVGLPPSNRRRMAVTQFRVVTGDSISWYGVNESSARWESILADKINERLTQTRKFTMVDRKFDSEIDAELARINKTNASKFDVTRLNQKLATDYLVVGTISFSPVVAPGAHPITGQSLPAVSQRFAEVSYRVLLAPTGQLKWADTVVVDALECPATDIASFMSVSASIASMKIADAIMASILPFEVVGVTAAGTVVIGEGGKSLAPGERFTVFTLGEMMFDSRTGEQLEELREPVATVEITRVTPKMSYARVIEGDVKLVKKGCILTRVELPPAEPQTQPLNTTVKPAGSGAIVTPF